MAELVAELLTIKGWLVGGSLLVFFLWERLRPAVDSPLLLRLGRLSQRALRRLARNLGLFSCNLLLSPLIVLPITAWAEAHSFGWRPQSWSGPPAFLADILLLDLWIYFWHRANHEIPFLWRFHEVHHLDEWLDTSSALRFHFGEVVLSAVVRAGVILLLDISLAAVLLFEGLVLALAVFHHSDAAIPPRIERRLSRIIVTPSIHWVHHHALRRDTDSNYGTIFSFWDRLFGSRSSTERHPDMPIGVEGRRDRGLPSLLWDPISPPRRDPPA